VSRSIRLAAGIALSLLAGAAAAQVSVPTALAPWLASGDERVVDRRVVPSPERKVGELRILKRGAATVVETLLYTKVLSRAIAAIREKEAANWPGDPDAARYVAALERAQRQIWERLPRDARREDRRQKLWIDFVVAPDAAFVALGAFELEEKQGEVRVLRREPLAVLEPAPSYVRRNLLLIVADAFQLDEASAARLVGPLP
jgi:hypothetical protein